MKKAKKNDFSNDTLMNDLDEVFRGMDMNAIYLVKSRLNHLLLHLFRVYQLPTQLRLKYCEAAIKVYFCLNRYGQFGEVGFTYDVVNYVMTCFELIEKKCDARLRKTKDVH